MTRLRISLLGSPQIELDGQRLTTKRRKVMALLAYLAVNPQPHQRDFLAALLWPGYDQSSARANLRKSISLLNLHLDKKWLDIRREQISLVRDDEFWLDIDRFQALSIAGFSQRDEVDEVSSILLDKLNQAVGFYRGDFLTGFSLPDAPEFTDWRLIQEEKLRRQLAQLCQILSQSYARQREWEAAVSFARRWLSLDMLDEKAHRQLMHLMVSQGQRSAAMRQYEQCREILAADLDVEPSAETKALLEEIRQSNTRQVESFDSYASLKPPRSRINLPPQLTTFVGRHALVAETTRLLVEEQGCRHVTLFGPGGVGKSRLAIKVAASVAESFLDGVTFVSLASIDHPDSLVPSINKALGLNISSSNPKKTLLDHLCEKEMLLVLDNYEHLILPQGVELLIEILLSAARVKLLITSRHRLNLEQEWSVEVMGMSLPLDDEQTLASTAKYEAVELFVLRARRVRQSFVLSTTNRDDVVRICHLVDGIPLGIELAAAWTRLISCQEIAQNIAQNIDFLISSNLNVPQRHHSLRAVFDYSWRLLSEEAQEYMRRLSVFRGGFTDRAAQRVAGATLQILVSLVDKALLHRTRNRRYQMHELLRQFAAEKLDQYLEDREKTRDRHAEFFLTFVQQLMDKWGEQTKTVQREILEAFVADADNVWLAWYHALAHRQDHLIGKAALGLYDLCYIAGWLSQGSIAFRDALDVLLEDRENTDPVVLGRLLRGYGFIHTWLGDLAQAQKLLEQSVFTLKHEEGGSPVDLAHSFYELSMSCWVQGLYAQTAQYAQESLVLFTHCRDRYQMGLATQILGWVKTYQAEYKAGINFLERSVILLQTEDGKLGVRGGYSKQFLGIIARLQGDYEKTRQIIEELIDDVRIAGHTIDLGYLLRELGYLNIALGQYEMAKSQVEEGLKLFRDYGARAASMLLITELGDVHRLLGEFDAAARLHHEALAIGREIGERRGVAICLENLGRLALDQKQHDKANEYYLESLAKYKQIGHPHGQATVLCRLGITALSWEKNKSNESIEAERRLHQALKISTKIGAPPLTLEILYGYALLWSSDKRNPAHDHKIRQLLSLILTHPKSEQETKDRARQLRETLIADQPADLTPPAISQTQNLTIELFTREILTQNRD